MEALFEACRYANAPLAVVAVLLLCMRVAETIAHRTRQDKQLGLIMVGYVTMVGVGSVISALYGNAATPANLAFTGLHCALILRMATWRVETV